MAILMFYQRPVALNRDVHRQLRLKADMGGFSYASTTNSVPLAGIEFADACRSITIVFSDPSEGMGFPLALVGLRQDENLFVNAQGKWTGDYIPAFVRRYPFVLQEKADASDFTVLIDEAYPGFSKDEGEPLFLEDGKDAEVLSKAIEFVQNYQAEVERTRLFVKRLREHELLVPRVIQVNLHDETPFVMQGFAAVDEQKLLSLPDDQLLVLARNGDLGWIYAHLVSLGEVPGLVGRLQERLAM